MPRLFRPALLVLLVALVVLVVAPVNGRSLAEFATFPASAAAEGTVHVGRYDTFTCPGVLQGESSQPPASPSSTYPLSGTLRAYSTAAGCEAARSHRLELIALVLLAGTLLGAVSVLRTPVVQRESVPV